MQNVYCPNQNCEFFSRGGSHLVKAGTYMRKESKIRLQRYQCKKCYKRFSQRFFTLNYRNRFDYLNKKIFHATLNGASNSAIGRILHVSETTIRKRIQRLSMAGLTWMKPLLEKKQIEEGIVYDGFESFSESQYFPFHLNFCIGNESHFVYNFNHTPLNRKGRMTEKQKKKRQEIYETRGKFTGNLLEKKTHALFDWCAQRSPQKLKLITDEHPAYERALKKIQSNIPINHQQINSKIKRDVHNKLFPANCLDLHLRQFLACFKRETISFCRTFHAATSKTLLFILYKNFMRPIFIKKKKNRIESKISPAMKIGLSEKIYKFEDIFKNLGFQDKMMFNKIHQLYHIF